MGSNCSWGRTQVTIPGISTSCSSNLKPEFPCPGRISLLNEYLCRDKRSSCSPKVYSWILVHLDEASEENKIQILIMKSLECHETCCTGLFFRCGSGWYCHFGMTQHCIRWPKNPVLLRLILKKYLPLLLAVCQQPKWKPKLMCDGRNDHKYLLIKQRIFSSIFPWYKASLFVAMDFTDCLTWNNFWFSI